MTQSPPDDLDRLFDFDVRKDSTLDDTDHNVSTRPRATSIDNIDEQVEVKTKPRKPAAKLDNARLQSAAGIPKLQRIVKNMRFKGKGHEFTDMNRLINTYQLWLDELFPKAKFADGLTMLEKLGHENQTKMARKRWLGENRRPPSIASDPGDESDKAVEDDEPYREDGQMDAELHKDDQGTSTEQPGKQDGPMPDMPTRHGNRETHDEQAPDEDELDALLNQDIDMTNGTSEPKSGLRDNATSASAATSHDFADDEEAMADIGW